MLYNVDTTSIPDVEKTAKQRCTTMHQRYFSVASMLVKAILSPIGLVMIMDF